MGDERASAVTAKKGVSGAALKMLAIVTMTIDHVAAVVIADAMRNCGVSFVTQANYGTWYAVYMTMRIIGRMAFPIYCFLLVEGFFHTRDAKNYAKRLLLFALLSEIPFDLAINSTLLEFGSNNVFFTLLLGLWTIMGMDLIRRATARAAQHIALRYLLYLLRVAGCVLAALCGMWLAESVLCTDYGASGVAAIVAIYLLRKYPRAGFAAAVILLGLLSSELEYAALLMLIPISFYNKTRGRQLKYVFYAYYPLHLLLLALVSHALGVGL